MNGYSFTERVRRVLQMARNEALEVGSEYVGTEHLLLGLSHDEDGVAAAVLDGARVDRPSLRARVLELTRRNDKGTARGPDLPYASQAKRVLELSMKHARELSHSYVGTEHLLLGLIEDEKGTAGRALREAGLTLERARADVLRLFGAESTPAPEAVTPVKAGASRQIVSFLIVVEDAGGSTEARRFVHATEAMAYIERLGREERGP